MQGKKIQEMQLGEKSPKKTLETLLRKDKPSVFDKLAQNNPSHSTIGENVDIRVKRKHKLQVKDPKLKKRSSQTDSHSELL